MRRSRLRLLLRRTTRMAIRTAIRTRTPTATRTRPLTGPTGRTLRLRPTSAPPRSRIGFITDQPGRHPRSLIWAAHQRLGRVVGVTQAYPRSGGNSRPRPREPAAAWRPTATALTASAHRLTRLRLCQHGRPVVQVRRRLPRLRPRRRHQPPLLTRGDNQYRGAPGPPPALFSA